MPTTTSGRDADVADAHAVAASTGSWEFLARREQAGILDLFGTLEWDETYDYKQERSRRLRSPGVD